MKEEWINLHISNIDSDVYKLCNDLLEWGALSVTVKGEDDNDDIDKTWFNEPGQPLFGKWKNKGITLLVQDRQAIKTLQKRLADNYPDNAFAFTEKVLENKDWVRHTQVLHDPIEVIPGYYIVAPWHKNVPGNTIFIDPGLGFGTGSHPTTYLCLQWIFQHVESGQSFLDYGCGSGILGVAAAVKGANPVHAIDIDKQALQATAHNTVLNGVEINFGMPDLVEGNHYDIIAANILAKPLTELSKNIIEHLNPGGTLIIAGILETQVSGIIQAYNSLEQIEKIDSKDGWALILGKN